VSASFWFLSSSSQQYDALANVVVVRTNNNHRQGHTTRNHMILGTSERRIWSAMPRRTAAVLVVLSVAGFLLTASEGLLRPQVVHVRATAATATTTTTTRLWLETPDDDNDDDDKSSGSNTAGNKNSPKSSSDYVRGKKRLRSLVKDIAQRVVPRPFLSSSAAYAQPDAIAEVLRDAAFLAVDEALSQRDLLRRRQGTPNDVESPKAPNNNDDDDREVKALIAEAFGPVEQTLDELEQSLQQARDSLTSAKQQTQDAIRAIQVAAVAQVEGAATATRLAQEMASRNAVAEMYAAVNDVDVESLTYEDVDFAASQMTPPFLGDDQCLVPGEPVVRVEKAPQNSRRIFAGIDIMASVDTVWNVLTDYSNLQNVVPNLEVNEIVQSFEGKNISEMVIDDSKTELEQCKELADQLKGSVLKQVGKVSRRLLFMATATTWYHHHYHPTRIVL
jgi:hypothetical protein